MQNSSQGSLQGCAGAIPILPPGPWQVAPSQQVPRMSARDEHQLFLLEFQMKDFGVCYNWTRSRTSAYENDNRDNPL